MLALLSAVPNVPHFKDLNHLYIALHSLHLFLHWNNSSPQPHRAQTRKDEKQEGGVKGRLPLFDIYKSLSKMYDAHPHECVRASVIRTRQACVCLCVVVRWRYQGQVH